MFGQLLTQALQDIAMAFGSVAIGYGVAFLKGKFGVQNLIAIEKKSALIKEVVTAGVNFAEQKFQSGQKLDEATKWISDVLTAKGLEVSQAEIEGMIESTIRELKTQFGEDWGKQIDAPTQDAAQK